MPLRPLVVCVYGLGFGFRDLDLGLCTLEILDLESSVGVQGSILWVQGSGIGIRE
jgi:hypothetical protein